MNKEWLGLFNYCKSQEMNDIESLEEFYNRKFNWVPDSMRKEIGHFNRYLPGTGKISPHPVSKSCRCLRIL